MTIIPQEFAPNEAWLLFQLNDAPVQTQVDGNFDILAIMDIATGQIFGMEFIGSLQKEPSEFELRKLLASTESEAGQRPQQLVINADWQTTGIGKIAKAMGLEVITESGSNLEPLTREAREGFAAHIAGERMQ